MPRESSPKPKIRDEALDRLAKEVFSRPDELIGYFLKQGARVMRSRAKLETKKGERKRADQMHTMSRKIDLLGRVLMKKR